ncbi:MAG: hypothetical protein AB8F94_00955 [Saprospiraceae bacterium]
MSDANYKNRLRKRLEDHSTPMNLESEWAALEALRPVKKKRPFIWFWFGSTAVILLFLLWFNTDQVSSNFSTVTKNDAVKIEQQSTLSSSSINDFKNITHKETVDNQTQPINKTNTLSNNTKGGKIIIHDLQTKVNNEKIVPTVIIKKEANIEISKKTNQSNIATENHAKLKELRNNITQVPFLPKKEITLFSISSPTLMLSLSVATRKKNIIKKKRPLWALGFKTAYGKTFRQLEELNPTSKSLVDRRNDFETALDSWNVTLNLSRMINQNWFAEIGIGYSHATDRFQDTYVTTNFQSLSDQVISIIYQQNGTTNLISGEVIVEETTTTKGTYYHYSTNTFAQIIFGRKFSFNDQFGSSFSTGLNYSLSSQKSGTIFKDDSANIYTDLSQSDYRKAGVTNLLFQAEVYYLMNKNWEASLGIQASGSLNNSFQNNSDFFEKRKIGSLQVGLKKWF